MIEPYHDISLKDPNSIAKIQGSILDKDVADTIFSAFTDEEPCVCYKCLKNWLEKMYVNVNVETEDDRKPFVLIRDLQRFQDLYENVSLENGSRRPGLENECLKEWLCSCVAYSKLQFPNDDIKDWRTEDMVVRLIYGAFDEHGNSVSSWSKSPKITFSGV